MSIAVAVNVCVPGVVDAEFQEKEKLALLVELTSVPSQNKETEEMPRESEADPATVTMLVTDELAVGAVMVTEGVTSVVTVAGTTAFCASTRPYPKIEELPMLSVFFSS